MTGLAEYFDRVAAKILSEVEASKAASNQHEINGAASLRPLLGVGTPRRVYYANHFDFDQPESPSRVCRLTWYDARHNHPTRSEWRLYYGPEMESSLAVGGLFVLATRNEELYCFTAGPSTPGFRTLKNLFALDEIGPSFKSLSDRALQDAQLHASQQLVLAELGLAGSSDATLLGTMFASFGDAFPSGERLSEFVRANTFGIDPVRDPDEAIVAWARVELQLFNAMEARVEAGAMDAAEDLDAKLAVAMRVFQRRRSRAGKAFEYHLRALFDANAVLYSPNPVTEGREEPDFIFPSIEKYRDPEWPSRWLTLLAAKQTLRDRWRQVLNEGERIERKHLATLDVSLSRNQIGEIDRSGIQLVVPSELQLAYAPESRERMQTLREFIGGVLAIQVSARPPQR